MTEWLIALAVLVMVIAFSVRLSRHSPARLSEEDSVTRRADHVVGRPAGPDAEATGVAEPGTPTTSPQPDPAPSPGRERRARDRPA